MTDTTSYPPVYPKLTDVIPSAPPDTGWRLGEISALKEQFQKMVKIVVAPVESINKLRPSLSLLAPFQAQVQLCSSASLICLSTGVGIVAAEPQGSVALGFGVVAGLGGVILKRVSKKVAKHKSLEVLACNRGDVISALTSQALMNGRITNEEFKLILQERESYLKSVAQIRSTAQNIDIESLKN